MALYDDLDNNKGPDKVAGWSSGIKLLQSQLALKKASNVQKLAPRKYTTLAPVMSLKAKLNNDPDDIFKAIEPTKSKTQSTISDYDWDFVDEYDPMWPNEYDKLVKDKRDKDRDKRDRDRDDSRKRDDRNKKRGSNKFNDSPPAAKYSGFGGRPNSDDEEDYRPTMNNQASRVTGAAIAPPLSLQETLNSQSESNRSPTANINTYGSSSVAAKIMAKYGFKDGQGLGKQEQGMSIALQVEKTSKRGGRIIHEKELLMPPPLAPSPPPQAIIGPVIPVQEPTITEIMKSPSKVVLLRNMVGPGDVDEELEPEVKDECNTKYGDVIKVVIHEIKNTVPEESVRIFVEFKRIESAIKAVVDLNGRFFGGRQVRAGFYNLEKFASMQLLE